jgi:hypothetical protein
MVAYIVMRLAGAVLLTGILGALFLPDRELSACATWRFLRCGADPELYMRWGLVGVAALLALAIVSITWAVRRVRI